MILNERQDVVANTHSGCVVVIAGPGSGKTRTLVERIERLQAAGAHPKGIYACTFTVRAADELEARLAAPIGYAGTIHGLARRLLLAYPDNHPLGPNFSILDTQDVDDLMKQAHAEARLRSSLRTLRRKIQEIHDVGGDPDALPPEDSVEGIDARRLIVAYRSAKDRLLAEDFDGLIARARTLLLTNPQIAAQIANRIEHLSVDEAQDLDAAQDQFLDLVAPAASAVPGGARSVLVVGDPLQSIYGWRGGRPEIMMRRAAAAHVVVQLGTNYRSVPAIVALSNRVADDDPLKPESYILDASRPAAADGAPAVVPCPRFADDVAEISALCGMVERAVAGGIPAKGVAVLARTNATLAGVARILKERGVPCQHLGQRKARLEQDELRGAVAYVRLAINAADDFAVLRALRCPARPSLARDPYFERRMRAGAQGASLWTAVMRANTWAESGELDALGEFEFQVKTLAAACAGPDWASGISALLEALATAHRALGLSTRADEIGWLDGLLRKYADGRVGRKRGTPSARGFLWWVLHGQGAGEHDPEADAVTLSTVHLAKGLEWPVVFVPGLVERVFPSSQSVDAAARGDFRAITEELRVFFVAATRAADRLILTSCATIAARYAGGLPFPATPSRFLRYAAATGAVV